MVGLLKSFIVVYTPKKEIKVLLYDNVLTYPGGDDFYAEFDTSDDLDGFLISEGLIETSISIVSKISNKSK